MTSSNLFVFMIRTLFISLAAGCTYPRIGAIKPDQNCDSPTVNTDYYSYALKNVNIIHKTKKKSSKISLETIEIPLQLPRELHVEKNGLILQEGEKLSKEEQLRENDLKLLWTNRIDIYRPDPISENEKIPLILISPILGGNVVVDYFARYYAKRGFISAIVHRKGIFWDDAKGIEQIENYLRTSIIRLRQALDWLIREPNVDGKNIGAFGISYGAILHSILASTEPRIKYHILAMPAAPLADVIISCPDKEISELIPLAQQSYGDTLPELRQRLWDNIKTDPILLSSRIQRENILMYIALFDRVVGARNTWNVWRAFGKPKLKMLPFGHYGGILILPILQYQTYKIFKKELQ